jgi:hypothetical protein
VVYKFWSLKRQKIIQHILQHQKNIESITQKAVKNLEAETTVYDEPVDEDWTTV